MAHSTHFLSRLDRASDKEVHVAMSLYYDAEFTESFVRLSHFYNLPENTERFAVALSASDKPSHAILTKEGSFVTCLGPSMKVSNLPVITWNKFLSINRKYEKIEANKAQILALYDNENYRLVSGSVQKSGRNLTQEDFKACQIFQPLLVGDYVEIMMDAFAVSGDLAIVLQKTIRKGKVRSKKERKMIREFWEQRWLMIHTGLLVFSDLTLVRSIAEEWITDSTLIPLMMRDRIMPTSLMAGWIAAKMGKCMFAAAKGMLLSPKHQWNYIEGALILTCIALRHSKYKSEVIKLLRRKIKGIEPFFIGMCEDVQRNFLLSLINQEKLIETLPAFFAKAMKASGGGFSDQLIEEAPTSAQVAYLAHNEWDFAQRPSKVFLMSMLLPWIISIEPEDFYIPKKYKEFFYPYIVEQGLEMTGGEIYKYKPGILKDKSKPGRNQPCHCGSGKKYKKCCFKKD